MVRRAGHRGASRSQVFHHERLNRSGTLRGAESADPFAVASKEARVAREIVRIEKAPVLDQQRADFFDVFEALNPCSGRCSAACVALRSSSEGDRRRYRESYCNYESFELAIAKSHHGTPQVAAGSRRTYRITSISTPTLSPRHAAFAVTARVRRSRDTRDLPTRVLWSASQAPAPPR